MNQPDRVDQAAAELVRQAERVADRLAVVAPRRAARAVDRPVDWSGAGDPVLDDVRAVCSRLAELGLDAAGAPPHLVPVLAPRALGDQLLVLVHELARYGQGESLAQGTRLLTDLKQRI